MDRKVTIVMYHYVRDLERSRYPRIKGLSVERFCKQLDYIQSRYTPVSVDHLLAALTCERDELPPNPILLTFDDGYADHFSNVFPQLDSRGIKACFYPSARPALEHRVLDVNKIQFLLASVSDAGALLNEVFSSLAEFRSEYQLKTREEYLSVERVKHRYDSSEVSVVKSLLQHELPSPVREEIVRRLFAKFVTADEAAFACELYMSMDQIACLRRNGMHVGNHGFSHVWLNRVPADVQSFEIDRSLQFLNMVGVEGDKWTMCYPYGGYNESVLQILKVRRCQLGFAVENRVADLKVDDPLTLPRIDTNDLPS